MQENNNLSGDSTAQNKLINFIYHLLNNSLENLSKLLSISLDTLDYENLLHLLLWCEFLHILESKSYLNANPHYFIDMYNKIKTDFEYQRKFASYGQFLRYFYDKIINSLPESLENPFLDDPFLGHVLIVGKSVLEMGSDQIWPLYPPEKIPDDYFYLPRYNDLEIPNRIDALNLHLIQNLPKDLPILNVLEIQQNFSGEISEFVFGALFEKFLTLTHKKSTGSYYTPQYISSYIVETIIKEYFQRENGISIDQIANCANSKKLGEIWDSIQKIRILDPSVGTGHFLISACHYLMKYYEKIWEIVQNDPILIQTSLETYDFLENKTLTKKSLCIFKITDKKFFRYIIKCFYLLPQSLYGIDINNNAVIIAKLRLFVDIVSESPINNPYLGLLSQLQMNIKCGNSLIGLVNATTQIQNIVIKSSLNFASTRFNHLQYILDDNSSYNLTKVNLSSIPFSILMNIRHELVQKLTRIVSLNVRQIALQINNEILKILTQETQLFVKKEELLPNNAKYFHWFIEFPEIFNNSNLIVNNGFTIILGNPPYGNILNLEEKRICKTYAPFTNEIAAVFIDRILNLQKPKGNLGLIVSYAITFSKDLSKTREKIAQLYSQCKIATFDRDRCRFFEGVTQSVSIIICSNYTPDIKSGNKSESKSNCKFFTTSMYRTMPQLAELQFQFANPFLLGEKIGSGFDFPHRIPKVGYNESIEILKQFAALSTNLAKFTRPWKILGDSNACSADDYSIFVRISGNYWYNAWDRAPYSGTQIALLSFNPEHKAIRNFCLLLLNSSLYYWWFRIYSDGRHMNADIMNAFPFPSDFVNKWKKWEHFLMQFLPILMTIMFKNFDSTHNRFLSSQFKGVLDLCDYILADFYLLSELQISFILNYESEIRGAKQIHPTLEKYLIAFISNPSHEIEMNFFVHLKSEYSL